MVTVVSTSRLHFCCFRLSAIFTPSFLRTAGDITRVRTPSLPPISSTFSSWPQLPPTPTTPVHFMEIPCFLWVPSLPQPRPWLTIKTTEVLWQIFYWAAWGPEPSNLDNCREAPHLVEALLVVEMTIRTINYFLTLEWKDWRRTAIFTNISAE